MRSGIVMEKQGKQCILLTEDGQFCRVQGIAGVDIGMSVAFDPSQVVISRTRSSKRRGFRAWQQFALAGVAASVAIVGGFWYRGVVNSSSNVAQAYAFVSLDINPSLYLKVDQSLKVLSAVGVNADGQTLLAHIQLTGLSLQQAMRVIVSGAISQGMLPNHDSILVSAAPAGGQSMATVKQIQASAQTDMETAVQSNSTASHLAPVVLGVPLSAKVWQAASDAHLPPGKFAAYLIASKEGMKVSLSDLKGAVLKKVLENPEAETVTNILGDDGDGPVDALIQQLQSMGVVHATFGASSNQMSINGVPPLSGHHEDGQNIVVKLGSTTLSVPIGDGSDLFQQGTHQGDVGNHPSNGSFDYPSNGTDHQNIHGNNTVDKGSDHESGKHGQFGNQTDGRGNRTGTHHDDQGHDGSFGNVVGLGNTTANSNQVPNNFTFGQNQVYGNWTFGNFSWPGNLQNTQGSDGGDGSDSVDGGGDN